MSKQRPILFSGPMVRAILDGRKTQTRRMVKPQPTDAHSIECGFVEDYAGKEMFGFCGEHRGWPCPYGCPGDRLWVRETWATSVACDDRSPSDMEKPGRGYGWPVWYAAYGVVNTRRADSIPQGGPGFTTMGKCRPSIFMPRWASRLTLEITGVRVERLNDISESDAMAEGCEAYLQHSPDCQHDDCCLAAGVDDCNGSMVSAKMAYESLWESINGKSSWAKNPWVWVIEFKQGS
jgi:hypothetical protein